MATVRRPRQRRTDAQVSSIEKIEAPHPEQIKAAIRMKGSSMSELARQWGVHETAVRHTVRNMPYPHIEGLIAEYLGTTPQKLWPQRFGPDGKRIDRRKREYR